MVDSVVIPSSPPWVVRWALGAPVVAVVCILSYARAWQHGWHGPTVAAVALCAWIFAVLVQWPGMRSWRERQAAAGLVVVAAGLAVYAAGWKVPRGLVFTAVPVVGLAFFQCLLGLGRHYPMVLRGAVLMGGAAALMVVWQVPFGWAPMMRVAVAAFVVAGAYSVWREADRVRISDGSQRLARSFIFASAVWLPQAWWRPGALLMEFLRWENAAFFALVLLVAWARPEVGGEATGAGRAGRRWVGWAALALAVATGLGGGWPGQEWSVGAPRVVLLGVAAGACVLAVVVRVGRSGYGWGRFLAWWPEVALLGLAAGVWLA